MEKSIYDACPIRAKFTDIGDRLRHTWEHCGICRRLKEKSESQIKPPNDSEVKKETEAEKVVNEEIQKLTVNVQPQITQPEKKMPVVSPTIKRPTILGKRVATDPFGPKPKSVFGGMKSEQIDESPQPANSKKTEMIPQVPAVQIPTSTPCEPPKSTTITKASEYVPPLAMLKETPSNNDRTFPKKKGASQETMSRIKRDRLELHKMKKTTENFNKKEAVMQLVQSRREEAKEKEKLDEKPKVTVEKAQMAWVPNTPFMLPPNSVSALNWETHRRYVAIISNLIKYDGETRFALNNCELEGWDEKLGEERQKYMEYVRKFFVNKRPYSAMFSGSIKFVTERFKQRLMLISNNGYNKLLNTVEWKNDVRTSSHRAMYVHKPTVLILGHQPKLTLPNPAFNCVFNADISTLNERYPANVIKALKDDQKATDLADEHNVSAMLSSCAMRHFLTAPFNLRMYRRGFPVHVVRRFVAGRPQRILIISNPIPISALSKIELVRTHAKYLIRDSIEKQPEKKEAKNSKTVKSLKRSAGNFSDETVQKKQKVEVKSEMGNSANTENQGPESEADTRNGGNDGEETGGLVIEEENEEKTESTVLNRPVVPDLVGSTQLKSSDGIEHSFDSMLKSLSTPIVQPIVAQDRSVDIFDSILNQMETPGVSQASTSPYTYSVIDIDGKGETKVLVRSRCHGKDKAKGLVISFSPKIEYIPQCGAETPFEEENIWNALTAMLKGSEVHATIHVNVPQPPESGHCLQLTTQKADRVFDFLKTETKELLAGRWKRFHDLLGQLKELVEGEYFLVETENETLEIWEESENLPEEGKLAFDEQKPIETEIEDPSVDEEQSDKLSDEPKWTKTRIQEVSRLNHLDKINNEPMPFESKFNGFLYHVALQWHLVKTRIPISFLASNPNKPMKQENGQTGRGRGRGRGKPHRGGRNNRGRGDHSGRGNRDGYNGRGRGGNSERGNRGGRGRGKPTGGDSKAVYFDYDANPMG